MATNPMLPPGMALSGNPLIPPGTIPAFQPPPVAQGPGLGFQIFAQDPLNNMKIQHSMSGPNTPLQPNAGATPQMASANPPQPAPMARVNPPQTPNPMQPPTVNVSGLNSMPNLPAPTLAPVQSGAQAQLGADQAKLHDLQVGGSGASQVENPFLRVLSEVGNIGAQFLAPQLTPFIPGTTSHNMQLQRNASRMVDADQGAISAPIDNAQKQAQTNLTNANAAAVPDRVQAAQDRIDSALGQHGLVRDASGNIVDDPNSEAYKQKQLRDAAVTAQTQLYGAQKALDDAKAQLVAAGNNPNSPAYQLAQRRLQIAQQGHDAANLRAQAYWGNYLMHSQGTGLDGKPLAGSLLTDNGQTVGTSNAPNVRPTGTQRGKANMATSAQEQLNDIVSIMQKNPTMFGPGYGQSTQFQRWVGSQSPDAQRFAAARTIAADHLAATFGGRSEAALAALDNAIGQYKDNPQAAIAGINQLTKANKIFKTAGSYQTVGGNSSNPYVPPTQGATQGTKSHFVYVPGKGLVTQ